MREIRGHAKSLRQLLGGTKFTIDYYQREYRWEKKHVTELMDDLSGTFLESHEIDNERTDVARYGHYFLGSIIISDKDSQKFIIDGQQRLTSLTLLLIHIYRKLNDEVQNGLIANLIFSPRHGMLSFNLDIPERTRCMEALFRGEPFDETDQPESVVNVLSRYEDIEAHFPSDLDGDVLPYFADWLIENVYLVEITAYSDSDAYTIFETMNDRGLSLTPTDMLKGYLLANITEDEQRNATSRVWSERIAALKKLGKDEDADCMKIWLRSQYALTIRERRRGAQPRDFDLIGTEFHRWVRNQEERLNLTVSCDFGKFINEDFAFYSRWYERIRNAAGTLTDGLETIYYNAQNNFTLQYPVLLAPLTLTDKEEDVLRKFRIVAGYIDTLIARRVWNWKSTSYSAMQYNMFQLVILQIRSKSTDELAKILIRRLEAEKETFDSNDRFRLHAMNGPQIHRLLARMTDYVETRSGRASRYSEYIKRGGKDGYEIEHIWADQPEQHADEFGHPADFAEYRSRIGALLLLPKRFNASFGYSSYGDKYEHYYGQNLLAQSLHENAYTHDPGFRRFMEESGLKFRAHREFKRSDVDARQELYRTLAEQIWNPANLERETYT